MIGGFFLDADPYPKDRRARSDAIQRALLRDSRDEVDDRVTRPDGEVCWLRSRDRVQPDSEGRPVRHGGVVLSLDEQKRAEAALLAREAQRQSSLDTVPEAMVVIDILSFSAAAELLFGDIVSLREYCRARSPVDRIGFRKARRRANFDPQALYNRKEMG
ncbi:hypothetical protein CHKEEEPN_0983 [Methylorubrum podarium]|nr:hypothetical protein CHKEEEPN_0983 [Methylorubrum podarium]